VISHRLTFLQTLLEFIKRMSVKRLSEKRPVTRLTTVLVGNVWTCGRGDYTRIVTTESCRNPALSVDVFYGIHYLKSRVYLLHVTFVGHILGH